MRLGRDRLAKIKAAAVATSIFVGGACSLVVDADRNQCERDTDCAGHGLSSPLCLDGVCIGSDASAPVLDAGDDAPPSDPVWGCVGKHLPPPADDRSAPVAFPLRFLDETGGGGRAGVAVAACEDNDPDCAAPIAQLSSDADGTLAVPLWSGFKGFLKIDPDAGTSALYSTYLPVIPIPDKNVQNPYIGVWPLFGKDVFPALATTSGGDPLKAGYGHLLFIALTCNGQRAPGMRATTDVVSGDTYGFYTDDSNLPSKTLQSTQKDGVGGFINLPSGNVVVTLRRDSGELVSAHTIFVRPDTLTIVSIDPN